MITPPRKLRLLEPRRPHLVVYSDASWEEKVQPRLGWIVFPLDESPTFGASSLVSGALLAHLIQRKTQIAACEGIAVPQALLRHPEVFRNTDVTWYIDNEAACSSLVRGSSSQEDIGLISAATHRILMELNCRIWWEWIDSDSNPSDGLSRDGCADAWTLAQGWHLHESVSLEWEEICRFTSVPTETLG